MINSNLGPISHHFRDTASFPLKMPIFPTHLSIQPKFENVPLAVHRPNFALNESRQGADYSCKTFSPKTYPLASYIHYGQTDERTENNVHSIAVARQKSSHDKNLYRPMTRITNANALQYNTEAKRNCVHTI